MKKNRIYQEPQRYTFFANMRFAEKDVKDIGKCNVLIKTMASLDQFYKKHYGDEVGEHEWEINNRKAVEIAGSEISDNSKKEMFRRFGLNNFLFLIIRPQEIDSDSDSDTSKKETACNCNCNCKVS